MNRNERSGRNGKNELRIEQKIHFQNLGYGFNEKGKSIFVHLYKYAFE